MSAIRSNQLSKAQERSLDFDQLNAITFSCERDLFNSVIDLNDSIEIRLKKAQAAIEAIQKEKAIIEKSNEANVDTKVDAPNIDVEGNRKLTPLLSAAIRGETEILQELIKAKANINAQDIFGRTALIWAIQNDDYEVAAMLVQAGANLELTDIRGAPALAYALNQDRYVAMLGLLLAHGVIIEHPKRLDILLKSYNQDDPDLEAVLVAWRTHQIQATKKLIGKPLLPTEKTVMSDEKSAEKPLTKAGKLHKKANDLYTRQKWQSAELSFKDVIKANRNTDEFSNDELYEKLAKCQYELALAQNDDHVASEKLFHAERSITSSELKTASQKKLDDEIKKALTVRAGKLALAEKEKQKAVSEIQTSTDISDATNLTLPSSFCSSSASSSAEKNMKKQFTSNPDKKKISKTAAIQEALRLKKEAKTKAQEKPVDRSKKDDSDEKEEKTAKSVNRNQSSHTFNSASKKASKKVAYPTEGISYSQSVSVTTFKPAPKPKNLADHITHAESQLKVNKFYQTTIKEWQIILKMGYEQLNTEIRPIVQQYAFLGAAARAMEEVFRLNISLLKDKNPEHIRDVIFHQFKDFFMQEELPPEQLNDEVYLMCNELIASCSSSKEHQPKMTSKLFFNIAEFDSSNKSESSTLESDIESIEKVKGHLQAFKKELRNTLNEQDTGEKSNQVTFLITAMTFAYGLLGIWSKELRKNYPDTYAKDKLLYDQYQERGKQARHGKFTLIAEDLKTSESDNVHDTINLRKNQKK